MSADYIPGPQKCIEFLTRCAVVEASEQSMTPRARHDGEEDVS